MAGIMQIDQCTDKVLVVVSSDGRLKKEENDFILFDFIRC